MKWLVAMLTVGLVCASCLAQTPAQRLEDQSALAKSLFEKHAYTDAAAAYQKIVADTSLAGEQAWPDSFYGLARAEALVGQTDLALAALKRAVDLGGTPSAGRVLDEQDLASLRNDQRFKEQVARLEKAGALWNDSPTLATLYKPVLSEEEKVAGLSKLWAEARFNFPFFGRVPDLEWDARYMAFLPQARAAQTTEDYYRVLMRFMAALKDGHTRVIAPPELHERFYAVPSLMTGLIDRKIVVTEVSDPALAAKGVRPGAELVSIDGRPSFEYAKAEVEPYLFGFTPQDRDVWLYGYQLLRGPTDRPVHLTFRLADGKSVSADAARHKNLGHFGFLPDLDLKAYFRMLPGNIAYIQVNVFADDSGVKAMRENFAAISATDGLIIDIRNNGGGNSDNAYALLKMLADKPFHDSNWRTRDYKAAQRSWGITPGWSRNPAGDIDPDPTLHYAKPVVLLTSARTYSAAEDFVVAFLSMHRGKLVGQTTGGSTGNPMLMKLPGGGMAFICTKDDSFPDGRVFEGVGIAPDVPVSPTIADMRNGRDPVLEQAIKVLQSRK